MTDAFTREKTVPRRTRAGVVARVAVAFLGGDTAAASVRLPHGVEGKRAIVGNGHADHVRDAFGQQCGGSARHPRRALALMPIAQAAV